MKYLAGPLERTVIAASKDMYVFLDPDGAIAGTCAAASRSMGPDDLEQIVNVFADVLDGDEAPDRMTRVGELGVLEFIPIHDEADTAPGYLVCVEVVRADPLDSLTERQREVALHASRGASVDEIAWELGISPNTVKYHLKHAYRRLDVSSRLQLAELLS